MSDSNITAQRPLAADTNIEETVPSPSNAKAEWRRTTKGWETVASWEALGPQLGPTPTAAKLHPAIVAVLQTLLSIGALLLFEQTTTDEA